MFTIEKTKEILIDNTNLASAVRLDRPERTREMTGKIINIALFILIFLLIMCDVRAGETHSVDTRNIIDAGANQTVTLSDIQRGSLLYYTDSANIYTPAPILSTEVEITVNGIIARTKLEQSFTNPGNTWVEGIYVFPLPENAAVDQLRMQIGERILEGQIHEREKAKKIYTAAKQQGKKATLMEQERPNMFTNSVANIGPGETITIKIEYQQSLSYQIENGKGKFQLRFPMTITPRYIPGKTLPPHNEQITRFQGTGWAMNTVQVMDASRITPPIANSDEPKNLVNISINLDAGFPISEVKSLYHPINVQNIDSNRVTATLQDEAVPADRDFNLVWYPEAGNSPKAALFTDDYTESQSNNDSLASSNERYHLIMVMPPTEGYQSSQPLPREVIYIIDTSGSMEGDSIQQAKKALQLAVDHLRPRDKFNIIQFNSTTDMLFQRARFASSSNLSAAQQYINTLQAEGGTEMMPALTAALLNNSNNGYVRQIIFLTDGAVGNETALFDLVQQNLAKSRLFTVGIGAAPNSYFMSKAARFGRGTFTYIADVNEVQDKMAALFRKLESPVLTNLQIGWPAGTKAEIWPKRLPDLYLGEPLIFSAKTKAIDGNFRISGSRIGQQWQVDIPLRGGHSGKGINKLWARNKISSLMDQLHEGKNTERTRHQIIEVALTHHLVSKFTSLVAVDITPSRPASEILQTTTLENKLPKGMKHRPIVGRLAQTATPAQLNIIIGFILLLFATFLYFWSRRHRMYSKIH